MVLEARGLDVTPAMIKRLDSFGDTQSADALRIIYEEEVDHVRAGHRWFSYMCEKQNLDVRDQYQHLVKKHFKGHLKPPFNSEARDKAGLPEDFYLPLSQTK